MDQVIAKVEAARKSGLKITADMYTYPAGATGLDAAMPPWVLDGGYPAAFKRLRDPETRKKIADAIRNGGSDWENLYLAAGSPERVILVEFKNEKLKPLTGKTLGEGQGGPANPRFGVEAAVKEIMRATRIAVAKAGFDSSMYGRIVAGLGLAGVGQKSDHDAMMQWKHPFENMGLVTDAVAACLGAHRGDDGAVVIVGTGSCGTASGATPGAGPTTASSS